MGNLLNRIPALNGVALALGVWAAPCNNDKVSFGNEGLCPQERHREEDERTEKGVGGIREIYCVYRLILHLQATNQGCLKTLL